MLRLSSTFFVIVVTIGAISADAQFVSAPSTVAVPGASQIILQDLNGDGALDVIVGGSGARVLLGNGNGAFRQGQSIHLQGPLPLVFGDFTGDGKPDLISPGSTCNGTAPLYLYKGNGDGTFQAAVTIPSNPHGCTLYTADFNHDGKLDLLVASSSDFSVLLGNGDGTFQTPVTTNTQSQIFSLLIGNFNDDGTPDVAVGETGGTSVMLGNGDGTFTFKFEITGEQDVVAAADLNKDSHQDLIFLPGGHTDVALGNGDGTFQPASHVGDGGVSAVVADFNLDGNPDIAVVGNNNAGLVEILLGNGNGTFQTPTVFFAADLHATSMNLGDFNGDGRPDLIIANGNSGNVSTLLGGGDGTFAAAQAFFSNFPSGTTIFVQDFNRDGKPDVATRTFPGPSLYLGRGDGSFQSPTIAGQFQSYDVTAGRFTQSGNIDFAVVNIDGIYLIRGNGDGSFQQPVLVVSSHRLGGPIAADVNGDGKMDIIALNGNNGVTFSAFLGNGDGTFQTERDFSLPNDFIYFLVPADMNGDGKVDLVAGVSQTGQTGQIAVLLGNGDGTFQPAQIYSTPSFPNSFAVGDINGDGKLDVVAVTATAGTVLLLGNGDGTLQSAVTIDHGQVGNLDRVAIGDFNGDGKNDVALSVEQTNTSGFRVRVLLNRGNGTFSATYYLAGVGPQGLAVADVDNDGKLDIVTSNPSVLLNNSAVKFSTASVSFGPQVLNTTSAPRTVTLTNQGARNWNISAVTASGDFAVTSTNCIPSLAAGHSCNITSKFTPTGGGQRYGSVTLVDTAPGSPQIVSLTGMGSIASVQPTSINFGNQPVNTTSAPHPVTLRNVSTTATLHISSITVTGTNAGDFSQSNNCGSSLGPLQSCTINVVFKPTAVGQRNGTVQITDDAAGSPQRVSLTGRGI